MQQPTTARPLLDRRRRPRALLFSARDAAPLQLQHNDLADAPGVPPFRWTGVDEASAFGVGAVNLILCVGASREAARPVPRVPRVRFSRSAPHGWSAAPAPASPRTLPGIGPALRECHLQGVGADLALRSGQPVRAGVAPVVEHADDVGRGRHTGARTRPDRSPSSPFNRRTIAGRDGARRGSRPRAAPGRARPARCASRAGAPRARTAPRSPARACRG
jgi:hypothetical protein